MMLHLSNEHKHVTENTQEFPFTFIQMKGEFRRYPILHIRSNQKTPHQLCFRNELQRAHTYRPAYTRALQGNAHVCLW